MGIKGFEGTLSEESKKALQSETWQKVRGGMNEKREVKHFTAESTAENAYGWAWDQIVKEYLRRGYNAEDNSPDIVVMGKTYKTFRRPEVTVFYDAAGDTLFDVTNERLEKEYEWLMNSGTVDVADGMDAGGENDADKKGDFAVEQAEEDPKAGEAPQTERAKENEQGRADVTGKNAESEQEPPEPAESKATSKQESRPAKQQAEEKLKKELAAAEDKSFADPIIGYLMERCREDEGLAEDVVQEHKTWQKCFDYIYSQAGKQKKGNCAIVRDDVVYEWAEDYYHKDDKAEEEKKKKKAAEDKAKRTTDTSAKKTKSAAERKTVRAKNTSNKAERVPAPPEPTKPKRNGKEMDGQLDMFSMMEM